MSETKLHIVKIKLDSTGHGSTELDGVVLKWVKGVSIESNAGMPTLVTIRLYVDEVEIEAAAPSVTKEAVHEDRPETN